MTEITIVKAAIQDAEKLTEIMKTTFDEEAKKWLSDQADVTDYNIQPPGYSSREMNLYMINHLNYYKVLWNEEIVGGIIVTISGESYGRIDRIFIEPKFQGKGIGSSVITLIEIEFPNVRAWDLETSSRQISNHRFYEKMGFRTTFETEDEFCYIKRIATSNQQDNLIENENIANRQYENCNMSNTEGYQVNLQGSSFSNSNLMSSQVSNCNLSQSTFQNINFRNALFADLNLSKSKFIHVTLGGVRFSDTNLGNIEDPISFERCNLEGGKLTNCNLKDVEITDSELKGMKINNIPIEELLEAYNQMKMKQSVHSTV